MIKADSAGRNNLSGGMDSPCLDSFPARRRGLGRNTGGFRTGGFRKKILGYKIEKCFHICYYNTASEIKQQLNVINIWKVTN